LAIGIEAPGTTHIWVCDLPTCTFTQFTSQGTQNDVPAWTPDGKRITYFSNAQGPQNIFWRMADASGPPARLMPLSAIPETPRAWSGNGNLLAFNRNSPTTARDIWIFRVNDGRADPYLATPALEGAPQFSPDGRWLAYISSESGRVEVYIQRLPVAGGMGEKWQISTDGGTEPVWNPAGGELFYRNGDRMMVVAITTQANFSKGQPKLLFEKKYRLSALPNANPQYDVSPDGQRFLMIK
jgi:serine/threonine-protein kinase